ncbi:L-rhamnose 1-epimerase [Frondihabitans sp. PAMC 28766]|uniref:L-rhamnose mutarotase n=1 Tax=Frondihabitans sp. PAMC 28766 TaxID=1795630 RepID=UPI00078CD224|nr:L-rhamnose mutarotase [Frondihabitans sp. PAMC 28766]AMM18828.1 L-rhamnose 1-epimerase [Frondihabitans sp. PAMC 28766]
MTRVCFQLQVDPSKLDEYRARHRAVWPSMLQEIAASGRRNYSLFLRPDGLLIGYYETDDAIVGDRYLAASTVAAEWEAYMGQIFDGIDGRADQVSVELEEVFNLEQQLSTAAAEDTA